MHKHTHKIVFLSAAGDFHISVSILQCKNYDFSIKIHEFEGKISKNWPSANYIFEKKAFGQ